MKHAVKRQLQKITALFSLSVIFLVFLEVDFDVVLEQLFADISDEV